MSKVTFDFKFHHDIYGDYVSSLEVEKDVTMGEAELIAKARFDKWVVNNDNPIIPEE